MGDDIRNIFLSIVRYDICIRVGFISLRMEAGGELL